MILRKMNVHKNTAIHLVLTFALKKEVPRDWLASHNIPVISMSALTSGALSGRKNHGCGMIAVITGSGPAASEKAARWIRDNISPYFVLNIGTCGVMNRKYEPGKWVRPGWVVNEEGDQLEMDRRCPIPIQDDVREVNSMISVNHASEDVPQRWKAHDTVDMECFAQAKVFRPTDTSFHSLKFSTDYSDRNTQADFNNNIYLFEKAVKGILAFLQDNRETVSVVVPVYNREASIIRAIDSVLSQSTKPEELIVVNDGSTDGTEAVIRGYGNSVHVINLTDNGGPSAARNEGVKHAASEWIAFLDSDDCWEKDKLGKQMEYLGQYPFYQIMQSEEIWIRNGKRVNACRHHEKKSGWIWEPSLYRCLISPSGVMMKLSLFERYGGFNRDLPVCEDYDLWLKISRDHPVGLDRTPSVIKYGGHADQLSQKFPAMDRFRVISLLGRIKHEQVPYFRNKMADVLREKLSILIQGCEKRGKHDEADAYKNMMVSLSDASEWCKITR